MISRLITRLVPYVAAAALALTGMQAYGAIANINPSMDNTVAEELVDNSSGACDSVFSGNTDNSDARRALMQFDVSQIPAGAVVNSVTLSMTVTRGSNHVDSTFTLNPINAAWVEGVEGCGVRGGGQGEPSTGGVTWTTQPGSGAASGSTLINDTAPVWSSTAALVSDVQGWVDLPGTNNGWMLIGDEANQTTARRFDSREGASPPLLVVDYTTDETLEACCDPLDGDCTLTVEGSGTCAGTTLPGVDACLPVNPCPQPAGACCNADNSCSDDVDKQLCETGGGDFEGGNCSQAGCGLTPFVEALPIPPILQPTGTRADGVPQYTISVEEAVQSVHPELPDTTVWTYNGSWPASTIVAVQGQPIEVTYQNNLPGNSGGNRGSNILEVDTCAHGPNDWGDSKRISTHLHGGHVPARVDGQPEFTILPGEIDIYEYPNNQEAGTVWYHDHALGITRLNVYAGMAGFYLIADDEDTLGPDNAFGLPSGQYEIGLAIQDRSFNEDGSLFYNAQLEDAFKGDYAVVNGKVNPFLNVNQGKYRFRILNGSQSREYSLRLENITTPENDPSFTLVGTDLGLISAPIDLGNGIGIQGPAERMDVVIDFAGYPAGTEIILRNDDPTTPLLPSIMKFNVTNNPGYTGAISSTLRTVTPMTEASADKTRYFNLFKHSAQACKDGSGRFVNEWVIQSLDGPCLPDEEDGCTNVTGEFWDDVTEFPQLGTREVWEFRNPTNSYHPMHVHLVRFQILSKEVIGGGSIDLQPWEKDTWKDIVHIPANTTARIIMDFEDYPGRFPNHCHLLDHEDHEMMRQFQTTSGLCNNNDTCDPGEDCASCADCLSTTGQPVSGAFCGNGLCEAGDNENCVTCAEDCGGRQKGGQQNQFCCGFADGQVNNPIGCGVDANDNRCIDASANLFCRVTARLSACCGDALCEGQEQVQGPDYCQNDCDPNACTPDEPGTEVTCDDGEDNDCDGLIDAADPDCQVCQPTEPTEVSCFNGLDDDCDEAVDCSDTNCDGALGAPTSCGVGICASTGNETCSGGTQGDTCTPGTPGVEGPFGSASCNDGLDNDCDGLTDANDPDCEDPGGVVCEDITAKGDCNAQPVCEWQGKGNSGSCVTVGGGVCTTDETPEVSCFDGNDNDCDTFTDCADTTDCDNANGGSTTCGVGVCESSGNLTCSGGAEIDSCSPETPAEPGGETSCNDELDNDCDGLTDSADPDCGGGVDCSQIGNKNSCNVEETCSWSNKDKACNPI
jgi:spore coat protein A